ncbi:MAG: Flp pilus assembly protein CpaB [Alphaproteobacteria bacterium]|nr:Flp pilus assembly protein CpaB [Alphaproteobacteria bacterium]
MIARTMTLGLLALGVAAGAAHFARNWVEAQKAVAPLVTQAQSAPAPKPGMQIMVAKKALPTGHFLKADDLRWQSWPDANLHPGYLKKGQSEIETLVGAVVRAGIAAGEPVSDGRIVKPGERGFMAAALQPGMRAVTVPVNATTGNAGFVFPGDHVDLILTHAIGEQTDAAEGTPARAHRASETVLTDLRVLAIDQSTNDQDGKPAVAKTATLEVTPKQTEVITVVIELGKLSLSLRSLAATQDPASVPEPAPGSHTWDSDASSLLTQKRGGDQPPHKLNLMRGAETTELFFVKKFAR